MTDIQFPEDFVWGVATSAFQIEGAVGEDGKGESIWDRFSSLGRVPGAELLGCDHYHRWEEDLDLLAALGVDAYRFSVAWTRVIPDGAGQVNKQGVDFYRRLLEGLRDRGISPYLTLYHWDLPQPLQDRGGWANRDTVDAFTRYAEILASTLGDLVTDWVTQNEPWVAAMLGHQEGVFAPGVSDWPTALSAAHHLLLSHGEATEVIRDLVPDASVGIALDCRPAGPATDDPVDVAAAGHFDGYRNRWYFDPVFGLGYPEDMVKVFAGRGRLPGGLESFVQPGDMDRIATPVDFLGLNYYTTIEVSAGGEESEDSGVPPGEDVLPEYTEMGWRIDPKGLERFLGRIHATYQPQSIVVTEIGASFSEGPIEADVVSDQRRIDYLASHIDAVARSRDAGVPVDGFFVWSLLDNLEWTLGYSQRFGLVWVDHKTGRRVPKESLRWYSRLISAAR